MCSFSEEGRCPHLPTSVERFGCWQRRCAVLDACGAGAAAPAAGWAATGGCGRLSECPQTRNGGADFVRR